MREGIERGQLRVHYQPIVAMKSRRIVGFEALVRWQHPRRGLVSPDDFIPLAEETGLIIPLGRWVLREACQQMRAWQTQYPADRLTVSVNLSAKQFAQPDLVAEIEATLAETALPGHNLRLEVTESSILEDTDGVARLLRRLRTLGVGVHIDDFGTGYSSLSRLQRLPIDTLKIDRMFMRKTDGRIAGMVPAIAALAHDLGMAVIVEGIETQEQVTFLSKLGCEYGQGYYFSWPVECEAATALLAEQHSLKTIPAR
ncbi:MAG: EAL domain-containing protein [Chloroflexi bacterium]|nr:EAL domain-containing protein [Chloroflexota bacterium]